MTDAITKATERSFSLIEDFQLYGEDRTPYGITIQSSSNYWHKHAFPMSDGYCIACRGNRYLLNTPALQDFRLSMDFSLGHVRREGGVDVYFGYDPDSFCGYDVRTVWNEKQRTLSIRLLELLPTSEAELASKVIENVDIPSAFRALQFTLERCDDAVTVSLDGETATFDGIPARKGRVGFSRPRFIGTVTFHRVEISSDLPVLPAQAPVKVEIPLVNGGTMPLTVEYELLTCGGKKYLKATLDGGPQYRSKETYDPYPCNSVGQYAVEKWYIDTPYVTYNGRQFLIKSGNINLVDPAVAWRELQYKLIPFSDLPASIMVAVDDGETASLGFGYHDLSVDGCDRLHGASEFLFAPDGAYLGLCIPDDTFSLRSPADKNAVKIIPKTVFDYPTVKAHFENNHYFTEDEEIVFTVDAKTSKQYLTYTAELQDVYGTPMEELAINDGVIRHAPLPLGLYRAILTVYYGGEIFRTVDTVFEVFDKEGKRSAQEAVGLPFQFSMPNEIQYLEHDPFDPWVKKPSANVEHFYPCVSYTGHVAEYKRTWEVTELFGRKWYVWFSDHRCMVDHDWDQHPDIVKHADYMYYPSEFEWGVLRSDFNYYKQWKAMPRLRALLDTFLDEHPGSAERIGLLKGEPMSAEAVVKLHRYYLNEWYGCAHKAIKESFIKQNKILDENGIKRACYGPFPVYVSPMRTAHLARMFGHEVGDTLSDVIYTGFAQFEDYPASCAYQTYVGAFGAGATLTMVPRLTLYPEQYGGVSRGGCIDGAVYDAHPPIGKYDLPIWFTTTHAREYVYNTPRKTADGFAYWSTYGFMRSGCNEEYENYFVKNWKYALENPPKRPLKGTAFVCEFSTADDRFEEEAVTMFQSMYNISEEGVGYLYETERMSGRPAGFFTSWENLLTLTEHDTNLLVLPSTENADERVLNKIRALHAKGVALVAVSSVTGLEDLFGVKPAPQKLCITELSTPSGEHESTYHLEDEARYAPAGADCVLYASDVPAIMTYGNTALLNISPCALGRAWYPDYTDNGRSSCSALLRRTATEVISSLATTIATSADCGITLLETKKGDTVLLCIDYSDHNDDKIDLAIERTVWFNTDVYRDAAAIDGKPLRRLISEDGVLKGVVVTLRRHESAMIRLS